MTMLAVLTVRVWPWVVCWDVVSAKAGSDAYGSKSVGGYHCAHFSDRVRRDAEFFLVVCLLLCSVTDRVWSAGVCVFVGTCPWSSEEDAAGLALFTRGVGECCWVGVTVGPMGR